jgi:hypothetical protein
MSDALSKHIETLRSDAVTIKAELARLKEEKARYESYLAPAYWALGVLGKHHSLLVQHRDQIANLLKVEPPYQQPYSEDIGQKIIDVMMQEVIEYKALVPKLQLTATQIAADTLKRRIEHTIEPFIKNPKQLNLEQRRMLLQIFMETGLTKENFEEYKNQVAIPWRKCPTHKIDLKFNYTKLKWNCAFPGCNYSE